MVHRLLVWRKPGYGKGKEEPRGPCAVPPPSYFTRAPEMLEEKEAKKSRSPKKWSARSRIRALRETSPFSNHIKVDFSCHVPILACSMVLIIAMVAVYMIGNCCGLFTSRIKASCQYLKKHIDKKNFKAVKTRYQLLVDELITFYPLHPSQKTMLSQKAHSRHNNYCI